MVSTDGDVNYKETFTYVGDSPSAYSVDAFVTTVTAGSGAAATSTIEGGYASAMGVSPNMVGLKAWTTTATAPGGKTPPPPKGGAGPSVSTMPDNMNDTLNAWIAGAAWAATATSPAGQTNQDLVASISF